MTDRNFDIIVWGATGFTGRLVAEYLLTRYGVNNDLRWAMAGRNQAKLELVRNSFNHPDAINIPFLLADSHDLGSLQKLAQQTKVMCTTVGPYALYGSELVQACVENGTHYCDLTGEVRWMRSMIDQHQKAAEQSGARIVHTCGFDSIPSDMGVYFMQKMMHERHQTVAFEVKARVKTVKGGFSGGTIASMMNMIDEIKRDPSLRKIMGNPYALNPEGERRGPDRNIPMKPRFDDDFQAWTAPFIMEQINSRVVRRTNALLGYPYGRDFRYDEAMLMGKGAAGYARSVSLGAGMGGVMLAGAIKPLRSLLNKTLPEAGEGPSEEQREKGFFKILFLAKHPTDPNKHVRGSVTGDRDPGYGSTSKMLAESAICLAKDDLRVGGGFWTPASAMGDHLLRRLNENAGVKFELKN
ncbi:MAG: saccharopine dehydrogenase NADP-binding domain-containing protein [Herpetosiphon sp.]|nr:saccharopine dehydrogenase NADP-binding domain-containing protein [Herpetosiphon sp.]